MRLKLLQVKVDLIILHFCVGGRGGGCWNLRWRGHPYTQHLRPQSCPGSQLREKDWGTKEADSEPAQTRCIPSLYPLDYGIVKGFIIVQKQLRSIRVRVLPTEIASDALPLFLMYCICVWFQKRTVKKSQDVKAKPKKDSDIVRERIIRRAALEFEDGMYGILF